MKQTISHTLFVLVTLVAVSGSLATTVTAQGNIPAIPTGTPGNIPSVGGAPSLGGTQSSPKLENPINVDTFGDLVSRVIEAMVAVLTPFVVVMFIYSGFLFVKAQGNETEITKAKTAITYSFIGAVILLGAWGFAQIIGTTVTTITGVPGV